MGQRRWRIKQRLAAVTERGQVSGVLMGLESKEAGRLPSQALRAEEAKTLDACLRRHDERTKQQRWVPVFAGTASEKGNDAGCLPSQA
jgi:hypothetical protein